MANGSLIVTSKVVNGDRIIGIVFADGRAINIDGINEFHKERWNNAIRNISICTNAYGTVFLRGKNGFDVEKLGVIDFNADENKKEKAEEPRRTGGMLGDNNDKLAIEDLYRELGTKMLCRIRDGKICMTAQQIKLGISSTSVYATFIEPCMIKLSTGREIQANKATTKTLWKEGKSVHDDVYICNQDGSEQSKLPNLYFKGEWAPITEDKVEDMFTAEVVSKLYGELSKTTKTANTMYRGKGWADLSEEEISEIEDLGINLYTGYFNNNDSESKSKTAMFEFIYKDGRKVPTGPALLRYIQGTADEKKDGISDAVKEAVKVMSGCKNKEEAEQVGRKYSKLKEILRNELTMRYWGTDYSKESIYKTNRAGNNIYEVKDGKGGSLLILVRA